MTIRSGLWFLLLAATACHSFAAFAAGTEIMQADVSTSAQISIGPTAISDSRAGVRSLARNNFAVASIQKDKNSTQRSQSFSNSLVSKKIGNVTLHIPQGYIDPMNGYPDYINIHALLPCLLPERTANTAEFHKNTLGKILVAILSIGDKNNLTGEKLLEAHLKNSIFSIKHNPQYKNYNISGVPVPGSNFLMYRDLLVEEDLFVRKNSTPLFLVECMRYFGVPFPSCSVREKIWGNVLLEYRYDRSFINSGVENSTKIDMRVHKLLKSFLTTSSSKQVHENEICK